VVDPDEVGAQLLDGGQQLRQIARAVPVVAVEEGEIFATGGVDAGVAAVASPLFFSCRISLAPGRVSTACSRITRVRSVAASSTSTNSKSGWVFDRRLRRVSGAYCCTL